MLLTGWLARSRQIRSRKAHGLDVTARCSVFDRRRKLVDDLGRQRGLQDGATRKPIERFRRSLDIHEDA